MTADPTNGSFRPILLDHARRYPAWQIADLYKLIHQASLGSEHAVTDREQARRWLETELAQLDAAPDEALIEPISPDDAVVRVHLGPLLERRLSPALLLDAFVLTSRAFHGSIVQLQMGWREAGALSRQGLLAFDPVELDAFGVEMRAHGFPAVHHSGQYVEMYHPAYRVVARVHLPSEWK